MNDIQLPKLQAQRNVPGGPSGTRKSLAGGDSTDHQDSVNLSHGERDGYQALSGRRMREALNVLMHGRAPAEPNKEGEIGVTPKNDPG